MRRTIALLVSVTTACLAASSCGASSNPPDERGESVRYAEGATFTMAVVDDFGAFDPYGNGLWAFARLAYDSLVNQRPDGEFVSGLAEEWTADADSATFTLRPGITCSDGTPLTASQVAADINHVSDPANQSALYGTTVPTVPLTATGDDASRTVTVELQEPFGFLLHTIGQLPIVCPRGLADPSLLESASDGTGPFVLAEVIPGQSWTFTVREDYTWGPDGASTSEPGTPARVVLRVVTSETTAANLLLAGEVNLAKVSGPDGQRLAAEGLERLAQSAAGAWLSFNQLDGRPAADLRVRQALVHALDLDEVVKVNTGGSGTASTGLVAFEPKPCEGDTVSGQLPEYDVAAAEALLDEAGWVAGADGTRSKDGVPLTLEVHYGADWSPFNQPTAELLAHQWEAIGVSVNLKGGNELALSQVLRETRNWDVYMQGYGFFLPSHAVPFFSGPIPPEGSNLAGVDNDEYAALVAEAQALTPPEACTYWDRAEQALFRNVDIAPIANQPNVYYLRNAEIQTAGFDLPIATSIRVLDE